MTENKDKKTKKNQELQTVSWESEEFIEYKKNASWYFTYAFLGIVVTGIFIFMQEYYSAAVVLLLLVVLFSQSRIKPKKNSYLIDEQGLVINNKKVYPFSEMSKFWLVINEEGTNVYIKTTKKISLPIVIHLGKTDYSPIVFLLSKHVPYDADQGEPINDRFSRLFKY